MTINRDESIDRLLTDLGNILGRELSLYTSLKDIMVEKQEHIAHARRDTLVEVSAREHDLATEVAEVTMERKELVEQLQQAAGCSTETGIDIMLSEHTDELARTICKKRDDLVALGHEIKRLNTSNQAILKAAVEHIRSFFDTISVAAQGSGYNKRGEIPKADLGFLNQEA